jgi:hypothetical protein
MKRLITLTLDNFPKGRTMKTRIALSALMAALMTGIASAASVNITMQNWAGPGHMFNVDRNAPVASVTGTADAAGLGAGYTLEITATSTHGGGAGTVGETNGGFTVADVNVNRFKDGSAIVFDMKIKDASDVDVTANYAFTITDLEAHVDKTQSVLGVLVDGTTEYEFHDTSTGQGQIWATNTAVPSYDVPDPSSVTFDAVGNPGVALRFNFSGMKLTVTEDVAATPATMIYWK